MARQGHDLGLRKRAFQEEPRRRRKPKAKDRVKSADTWCRIRGHKLSCACIYQ